MEAIRTYGCAEEGLETEVTITDLGHGHGNQKLVFNKKFIHKLNFDYFANIYVIKGYFPNNNYDETFEGVKLNRWASCANDSKKAIRKINIRWVQGDQAVRELTFNAYALAYKEELTREGHYFYLILRDVNQKISHNNIILAPQDDIIYLTVTPYKENTSLILLLKRLEERYNFAGQLKGDYSFLGDLPRKKFSNKNSILKVDYWEFELWISATTKEMKRIFFELNVYFSSKGYDGLVDDSRPLNLFRKLIGAIGGSIAERIHNGVGINKLKKGDLTFLFSDFKEKLRKLIKNKEIIFKLNFNSITLTQDRESHIGGGFAGSNLSSTQQSTSQQNLNSSYSPTSTVGTTNNKQVKDEEVKRKKKEEVKVRTKGNNDKKEDKIEKNSREYEKYIGLSGEKEIYGLTSGFYNIRDNSGNKVGKLDGNSSLVKIYDLKEQDGNRWVQIKLINQLEYQRLKKYNENEDIKIEFDFKDKIWVVYNKEGLQGINPIITYEQFLDCLEKYEELESDLTVQKRITKLRQMAHPSKLIFDDVIGTEEGDYYEEDRPQLNDFWQLLLESKAIRLPNGEIIDMYHFIVGMDVLQKDRMEEKCKILLYDIGSNYSAATWSGDIGAGVADKFLEFRKEYDDKSNYEQKIRDELRTGLIDNLNKHVQHKFLEDFNEDNFNQIIKNEVDNKLYESYYAPEKYRIVNYKDRVNEYLERIEEAEEIKFRDKNEVANLIIEYIKELDKTLLKYYYNSRAPKHDLLGDIDAWGTKEKIEEGKDSKGEKLKLIISNYYDDINKNRKIALMKFLKHYGFTTNDLEKDQESINRLADEIYDFSKIWLRQKEGFIEWIDDYEEKILKYNSKEMAELFVAYLKKLVKKYRVDLN